MIALKKMMSRQLKKALIPLMVLFVSVTGLLVVAFSTVPLRGIAGVGGAQVENTDAPLVESSITKKIGYKGQSKTTVLLNEVTSELDCVFYEANSDGDICEVVISNNGNALTLTSIKHGSTTIWFRIENNSSKEVSAWGQIEVEVAKAPLIIADGLNYFGAAGKESVTVPLTSIATDPDGESITISGVEYGNLGDDSNYYTVTINGGNLLINFVAAMPAKFSKIGNLTVIIKDSAGVQYRVPVSVDSQIAATNSPVSTKIILAVLGAVTIFLALMIFLTSSSARKRKRRLTIRHSAPVINYLPSGGSTVAYLQAPQIAPQIATQQLPLQPQTLQQPVQQQLPAQSSFQQPVQQYQPQPYQAQPGFQQPVQQYQPSFQQPGQQLPRVEPVNIFLGSNLKPYGANTGYNGALHNVGGNQPPHRQANPYQPYAGMQNQTQQASQAPIVEQFPKFITKSGNGNDNGGYTDIKTNDYSDDTL
jgi:hypothetical protein